MTSQRVFCSIKPYIQPFERKLALSELEAVSGAQPAQVEDNPNLFEVSTDRSISLLTDRLTYWEKIAPTPDQCYLPTRQVLREATTHVVRNGITPSQLQAMLPFTEGDDRIPVPNRRVLRYGSHGIHEYRGKFFPQLARALLNVAGVEPDDLVVDPMCGSGTTLVEAFLLGCRAVGADMNPLSVLMSQTKCEILKSQSADVVGEYDRLKAAILEPHRNCHRLDWFQQLSESDRSYLQLWFSDDALRDLDWITSRIQLVGENACRNLFRLCLSNILRRVSWQKDDDLRVRRDVRLDDDVDVIAEFVNELSKTLRVVLSFLLEDSEKQNCYGSASAYCQDVRTLLNNDSSFVSIQGKVKAIVTSPPYATALPYLDTDRLSLCYLGLLPRSEHRVRDRIMIGNREITENLKRGYWAEFQARKRELPQSAVALIENIANLNSANEAGFRRRNLPALLARYFLDMRQVLLNMRKLLRPDGIAYVVIGSNHTIAGGQRIDIETDKLLGEIGESVGFSLYQVIPMEMLISRDIFKHNAVTTETILAFT